MIRGVHHVAISTPNLKRLLHFYRDLLGFEELERKQWPPGTTRINRVLGLAESSGHQAMLRAGNLCLELFEFSQPTPQAMDPQRPVNNHGHTHLCLDVTDVDALYDQLCRAGISFHAPPQNFGSLKATYGRDPDGNVFEIQQLLGTNNPLDILGQP